MIQRQVSIDKHWLEMESGTVCGKPRMRHPDRQTEPSANRPGHHRSVDRNRLRLHISLL